MLQYGHRNIGMEGEPQAQALNTLTALLSWQAGHLIDELFCRGSLPLAQAGRKPLPSRSRLLVCHDLAGGYGADRFAQGSSDACQFRLHQWHSIDLFVYFSHRLVAIPPPGWINCAHRHGTLVLGTFITEWTAGALKCLDLLATQGRAEQYALQLSKIMAHYNFDGWLINIENPVLPPLIPNLQHFLRVLTAACKKANPHSQVIWYDAVTTQGLLKWQDTLNELNAPFFGCCDALFVNYTWKAGTPQEAAAAAGSRARDVYMGIDVFGRNTFGGGGFNSNSAAAAARQQALFAPAWVWEKCDAGDRHQSWLQREHVLWSTLAASWEAPRAICSALPFFSNFNCGAGQALYQQGEVISHRPWFNLSCQELQPLFQQQHKIQITLTPGGPTLGLDMTVLEARVSDEVAWGGGCSMTFAGRMVGGVALDMALFVTRLTIPKSGVLVTYTFLPPGSASEPADFALLLSVEPSPAHASARHASDVRAGDRKQIRLGGCHTCGDPASSTAHNEERIICLPSGTSRRAQWVTRSFSIDYPALDGFVITRVGAECSHVGSSTDRFVAHLGEITIAQIGCAPAFQHADQLRCTDVAWHNDIPASDSSSSFSCTLHWAQGLLTDSCRKDIWWQALESTALTAERPRDAGASGFGCQSIVGTPAHSPDCRLRYLGCAFVSAFRIVGLLVPASSPEVLLQVRGTDRLGNSESAQSAAQLTVTRTRS